MRYVVIGNGVAGITAVQILAKEKSADSIITQFTDEPFGYYNRPKIPAFVGNSDVTVEDTITYGREWYEKINVDLHLQEKVEKISVEKNEIKTQKASYSFDRLLVATGADCWCPPIEGRELSHFYTMRNLDDALKIRERFKTSNKTVVIGGGVLGLEMANAAINQKQQATVIEFAPYLLPRQLDQEGSSVLQRILESRGINVLVGKEVQRITGKKEVSQVITKDGIEIPAEIVIVCTGIKPRINLVKDILEVNRGIIVNDFMETSEEDIFAAGDCTEHRGIIYGLIPPSMEQARIAAHNMIRKDFKYEGSKIAATLKVTNIFLSSFGYTGEEQKLGYAIWKYISEEEYVKLFIHKDKLKAAIILGVKKAIPLIRNIFTQEKSIAENETKIRKILPGLS